jgi:hypothetical protein
VYDVPFTAGLHGEAAAREYLKHRQILGQYFRDQRIQAGRACNLGEMTDQVRGDAQSLMRVVDRERNFGATRW